MNPGTRATSPAHFSNGNVRSGLNPKNPKQDVPRRRTPRDIQHHHRMACTFDRESDWNRRHCRQSFHWARLRSKCIQNICGRRLQFAAITRAVRASQAVSHRAVRIHRTRAHRAGGAHPGIASAPQCSPCWSSTQNQDQKNRKDLRRPFHRSTNKVSIQIPSVQ